MGMLHLLGSIWSEYLTVGPGLSAKVMVYGSLSSRNDAASGAPLRLRCITRCTGQTMATRRREYAPRPYTDLRRIKERGKNSILVEKKSFDSR